jgi:hypothetical protein
MNEQTPLSPRFFKPGPNDATKNPRHKVPGANSIINVNR